MKLALLNLFEREEAIDDENGDIESLRKKAELPVHVDNPLNKESTARVLYFCWNLHLRKIVCINLKLSLYFSHISVDFASMLSNHLGVSDFELVGEGQIFADLTTLVYQSLLENLSD